MFSIEKKYLWLGVNVIGDAEYLCCDSQDTVRV